MDPFICGHRRPGDTRDSERSKNEGQWLGCPTLRHRDEQPGDADEDARNSRQQGGAPDRTHEKGIREPCDGGEDRQQRWDPNEKLAFPESRQRPAEFGFVGRH